jgi:hypothetical protein
VRLAVARQEGLDEPGIERIQHGDGTPAQRAALVLADSLMSSPGRLTDDEVAELRRHFTDSQLLELTLDVMKWNYQKVPVALGTDDEVKPGELVDLVFDEAGHWVRPTS